MNYRKIAKKLNKDNSNEYTWFGDNICNEVEENTGIVYFPECGNELRCYWVSCWMDTDSFVGTKMYFLNNEPVAISTQTGRKSPEEFKWFSKQAKNNTKEYIHNRISVYKNDKDYSTYVSIDTEICDSYKVDFVSQVPMNMWKRAIYNGHRFTLVDDGSTDNKKLTIKLDTCEVLVVDIRDIDFMINII